MRCSENCFECPYDDCILDDEITLDDMALSREIDAAIKPKTRKEETIAAYQREYYEQNRESIAAKQREYREQNRESIAAYQRRIYDARKALGYSQSELGRLVGVSQRIISYWERGEVPADWELLMKALPELREEMSDIVLQGMPELRCNA